jgi:sRNA-binding regulator protein Hfq
MLNRTLPCLAVTCISTPLLADTVWLKNGDKLTGTITVFDGGKLLLQTDYAGAIPLDWKQIKTLESNQKLLVKQDQYQGEVAKSLQASDDGKVTLTNGDAPKTVELASIQQILKPKPIVTDLVWKGNIDAALDFQRAENDVDDYNIAFKTTARHGQWRHNAKGEYNRESTDDAVTTDNWSAEYSIDRFFTDKWFWDGRVNYKRDKIEDLSRQRTVGTGPGYQFWDDELGAFKLGALLNRTDFEYSNGAKDNFYSVAGTWDYNRFLIGKKFEFFTNGELGRPLNGVADYSLEAEVGLRYKVTDWASLNVKAEKDLISGPSDGELDKTRYTAGFGVTW